MTDLPPDVDETDPQPESAIQPAPDTTAGSAATEPGAGPGPGPSDEIASLEQIAADLAEVEATLERLESGAYWSDDDAVAPPVEPDDEAWDVDAVEGEQAP